MAAVAAGGGLPRIPGIEPDVVPRGGDRWAERRKRSAELESDDKGRDGALRAARRPHSSEGRRSGESGGSDGGGSRLSDDGSASARLSNRGSGRSSGRSELRRSMSNRSALAPLPGEDGGRRRGESQDRTRVVSALKGSRPGTRQGVSAGGVRFGDIPSDDSSDEDATYHPGRRRLGTADTIGKMGDDSDALGRPRKLAATRRHRGERDEKEEKMGDSGSGDMWASFAQASGGGVPKGLGRSALAMLDADSLLDDNTREADKAAPLARLQHSDQLVALAGTAATQSFYGPKGTRVPYGFAANQGIWDVPELGYNPRSVKEPPGHMGVKGYMQRVLRRMPSRETLRIAAGTEPKRCCVRQECSGDPASKICVTCSRYYPQGGGAYCDACFTARHPEYRIKHVWYPFQPEETPRSTTSSELLEEDLARVLPVGGIRHVIMQARAVRKEAEKETRLSTNVYGYNLRLKRGLTNCEIYNGRMQQNMEELRYGVPHSMARKIQKMARLRKARKTIRRLIRAVYHKAYDPIRKSWYYIHNQTGEVSWTKPALLGSDDVYQQPRRFAKDLTRKEAAEMIQGMFKSWKVRKWLKAVVRATWKRVRDPETGEIYFFNPRTKEVQWDKPRLLGDERFTPRHQVKKIRRSKHIKPDEAARMIQGMFHSRQARRRVKALIRSMYVSAVDPGSGKTYYYNKVTHATSWTKPALLFGDSLTPRPEDEKLLRPPIKRARDLSEDEAAMMIGLCFRHHNARRRIRALVRSQWRAAVDNRSGRKYYFNIRTQEVSWTKPLALGSEGLTPRPEDAHLLKKKAAFLTDDEAHGMIVNAWRTYRARKIIARLAIGVYRRVKDEASGEFYWVNKKTGATFWHKPKVLEGIKMGKTPRSDDGKEEDSEAPKPPRWTAADLSPDEAALVLQRMARTHAARRLMRRILRGVYKKVKDVASGEYYYVNTQTGEVSWDKPKLMKQASFSATPRKKLDHEIKKAADLSEDEAARMIQAMGRAHAARRLMRNIARGVYKKVETPDGVYYMNKVTGEAQWDKPLVLRAASFTATPRKLLDHEIRKAEDMSEDEAVRMIQAMARAHAARRLMRNIARGVYQKVETEDGVYYVNKVTGEAQWEKPAVLRKASFTKTPRKKLDHEIKKAADLSDDEAARMIQAMARAHAARRLMRNIARGVYQKVETDDGVYYVNKITGEAQWDKPIVLRAASFTATPRKFLDHEIRKAADMTEEEAASIIQSMARAHAARRLMRNIARGVYQKVETDEGTYYVNKVTGEAQWDKPVVLRKASFTKTPRKKLAHEVKTAEKLSDSEAASMIQAMARAHAARRLMRNIARGLYQKVEADGGVYYVNKVTGEAQWDRPLVLRQASFTRTPRKKLDHEIKRAEDLSDDQAARMIQGMVRHHRARMWLIDIARSVWVKTYDPDTGDMYYFNTRTKQSSWDKPKILGKKSLDKTPRDKDGSLLSEDAAARRIQGCGRHYIARRWLIELIRGRYTKVWDEEGGYFYYFDTVTGQSAWEKPKLLGTKDLEKTPREEVPEASAPTVPRTPRWVAAELDDDRAASIIQGMFRHHQARKLMAEIAKGVFTKVWDESLQAYYYFNTQTKESTWDKPTVLGEDDVDFHGADGAAAGDEHHDGTTGDDAAYYAEAGYY